MTKRVLTIREWALLCNQLINFQIKNGVTLSKEL